MISISIDLMKIPKELIKLATTKDGKKAAFITLSVGERKQVDQFNNTHYVSIYTTKEQKKEFPNTIYIGNGKQFTYDQPQTSKQSITDDLTDDLPF